MEKEFKVSRNVVELPSKGKLYENNIDLIEIEYMTAKDEDLLTSPQLLKSGKVLDVLLDKKMMTEGIRAKDLLLGDKNMILLQLRADSYGQFYTVSVTCPYTGGNFEYHVDLAKLKIKELTIDPDENMLFPYTLPISKQLVKFKLLTSGEMDEVIDTIATQKTTGGIETNITSVLKKSIKSIDDNTDYETISKYVDIMRAGDSLSLRHYIEKITPTVDNTVEIISQFNDKKFNAKISFGADFFYPSV